MIFQPRWVAWLFISCLLWGCQSRPQSTALTIATAANMQFAIAPLVQAFTQQTGIPCNTIISSSGKLTAQIKEGAPFDIFVSADMQYPTVLFESGLTTSQPKVYALGKLILWSHQWGIEPSIASLTQDNVRHIALANPKIAPYGEAAIATLKHYQIYNQVKDKLVFGENIAQTNQFITSSAADIGFTAQSVVFSPVFQNLKLNHQASKIQDFQIQEQAQRQWQEVSSEAYSPIQQGVVLLRRGGHVRESPSAQAMRQQQAQQFYDFLFTEIGQEILIHYGYSIGDGSIRSRIENNVP